MTHPLELATALTLAQRRLAADRLRIFALGWLGATVLFVVAIAADTPAARGPGLLLCLAQLALVVASVQLVRARPEAPAVEPIVLATCAGFGLSSLAFYLYLGGHEPVVAMMLFALGVVSSLLFAWRWYAALTLFAATFGPWLFTNPWAALQLTPLQGVAGLAVGVLICVTMAEGSFRGTRAAVLHRMRELERTRELQASRDAYRDLAENAADLIWTADLDWRFTYVNAAAARHLARPAGAAVGLSLRAVMTDHPANAEVESVWARIAAGGSPEAYTVQVRPGALHPEPRWFDVVASPVRDARDRIVGIRGISRDVTARRRAEEALRASREKLRQLAHGQVRVREEERKRLGIDLHDDVCQELVGIGILIESVRARLGVDAPGRGELARAVRYLGELVDHLRGLARDLRPLQLPDLGLQGSLRALVAGMTSPDIRVMLALPATLPRLDEETEIAVYRIAQEALTNATRHGGARQVHVAIAVVDGRMRLEVRDDGRGFDPAGTEPGTLGLVSMEERALAVGGSLDVESASGAGTIVRLTCPLALPTPASAA
jgi:two-component system, NarL family, sensor histidine kinase UhpB